MYLAVIVGLLAIFPTRSLSDWVGRDPSTSDWGARSNSRVDVIERDVAIIGGGSSGTYSAVRLRDHGKSVIVIEKKGLLGGHAETWKDPTTDRTINGGVVVFTPTKTVEEYFARFNVSLVSTPSLEVDRRHVDFANGGLLDFNSTDEEALRAALRVYTMQLEKYPELQYSFNLTYPVPTDLLLSFKEFAVKYKLEDLVLKTFATNQGYVPILDISMLYIFKYLNTGQLLEYNTSFLTTARKDTQELYRKATDFLSPDVLLNAEITSMKRWNTNEGKVELVVQTPQGAKLVRAKKLLSTVPPMLSSLTGFDLSDRERELFQKFTANGYYSAILNNTGLNEPLSAASGSNPYHVPDLPGPYAMTLNQELTQVYYGSPHILTEDAVKADILNRIQLVRQAQGLGNSTRVPEWVAFYNHAPFNLMVSNEEIRKGFYADLFALQGQRNTFYSGAAWHAQDSSALWEFTDNYVVPMILESL
ncbi:FAD/NAD(P)-binding domain-containing protein [Xylariaceae sp. FL1019]|nr:FAD/NAD(P)-binding domain-containing protein [Xylariaceae sp. FL1019]